MKDAIPIVSRLIAGIEKGVMTTLIKRRQTAALWLAFLATLAASSAVAQIRKLPTIPDDSDRATLGTTGQAASAHQASYTFLTIDPQGEGHCYADARGPDQARQVVVDWSDPDDCNLVHASLWDGTDWTALDFADPKCPDVGTYFTSLNSRGIAFGTYWSISCNYEPAAGINVKTGRSFALPGVKDFPFNQGISMSNDGLAVGVAWSGSAWTTVNEVKHWIWDGRKYLFPTFPADWDVSGFWAGPLAINDSGQIAGQYVDTKSGRLRGYFQHGWNVTTFDAPGDPELGTYVNALTDSGDVLLLGGYAENSPYYPYHNFSWRQGVFTTLPNVPFPEAVITFVHGLNDRGDFSGVWLDGSNLYHAFAAYRK